MNTADPAQVREIIERLRAHLESGGDVRPTMAQAADLLSSLLARAEEAERRAIQDEEASDIIRRAAALIKTDPPEAYDQMKLRANAAEQERARLAAALEQIAAEEKVYKGYGDYDILPACTAEKAQDIARAALSRSATPQTTDPICKCGSPRSTHCDWGGMDTSHAFVSGEPQT